MITHIPTQKTIKKLNDAGEGKYKITFHPGNEPEEMIVAAADIKADGGVEELQRTLSRPPRPKPNYHASNGLSIIKLRQDYKCKVKIMHYRMATFHAKVLGVMVMFPTNTKGFHNKLLPIKVQEQLVPTYYKPLVSFSARGGETIIHIETPSGHRISTSSKCHEKDNFCYKLGVKYALEHLYSDELQEIVKAEAVQELHRDIHDTLYEIQ